MLDASLTPHTHTHKIASSRFMGKRERGVGQNKK